MNRLQSIPPLGRYWCSSVCTGGSSRARPKNLIERIKSYFFLAFPFVAVFALIVGAFALAGGVFTLAGGVFALTGGVFASARGAFTLAAGAFTAEGWVTEGF